MSSQTFNFVVPFFVFFKEVIEKYKSKVEGLDQDLKEILKQEGEEKEV